jgi:hypothetical protein
MLTMRIGVDIFSVYTMGALVQAMNLEQSVGSVLGQIEQVEGVYISIDGELLNVFTVIGDDDEEAYDRIYDRERVVIHQNPTLHFDFNVIARRGRPVTDILGQYAPIWQRSGTGNPCHSVTNI